MYISKLNAIFAGLFVFVLGLFVSMFFAGGNVQTANAQAACIVDQAILAKLYNAVFHRPLDAGASFHLGKPLDVVLDNLAKSQEHMAYSGLFEAVKVLEEAGRNPNGLSDADRELYKDIIDSALSNILAWSTDVLPRQNIENRVLGVEEAKSVIQNVYDSILNATAREKAQFGLFNALERIGQPRDLPTPSLPPQND